MIAIYIDEVKEMSMLGCALDLSKSISWVILGAHSLDANQGQ